jgi:hypothetical protein
MQIAFADGFMERGGFQWQKPTGDCRSATILK